jgi:hypothetical protein
MTARYVLITTKYGGPGIYDAEARTVAPFEDDAAAQDALLSILDGDQQPDYYTWREAYASEVVL